MKTQRSRKTKTRTTPTAANRAINAAPGKPGDIRLTREDYRHMGKIESLYVAAEIFDSTKLSAITPKAVAGILRMLADEICSVDSVRAFKMAHTPGLAQEFQEALRGYAAAEEFRDKLHEVQ